MGSMEPETKPTWVQGPIVVGAGPSGISVAACLAHVGIPSTVLEKSGCIASLWQNRTYNRLRLHLPKRFCELPLMGFPAGLPKYPVKQQFTAYMESYAAAFGIQPRFGTEVMLAEFDRGIDAWRVRTRRQGAAEVVEELVSRWLVVATGENAEAVVPELQGMENFSGRVLHTSAYKSGEDFAGQKVLVVGCGNSGMEVSLDLSRQNAKPYMVVRNTVHLLPREVFGVSTFGVATALLRLLPVSVVDRCLLAMAHLTLGDTQRLGLRRPKAGPMELKNLTGKTPVLDMGTLQHIKSGRIKVMQGVKEMTRSGAKFVDEREEQFDSVIFATGYKSNVPSWLKGGKTLFTNEGMAKEPFPGGWRSVDGREKGLYCVGFTRRGLLGISSDALSIAGDILLQWNSPPSCKNKS